MSRASRRRRKEQAHDPHWIAVRNLLALYGMRMTRTKTIPPPVNGDHRMVNTYHLQRGKPGHERYVGHVTGGASHEEWTKAVVKADKVQLVWCVPHWAMSYSGHRSPKLFTSNSQMYLDAWKKIQASMAIPNRVLIHDEVVTYVDEAGSIYQIGNDVAREPPPPAPPRRGWRGYTGPARPVQPVRLAASGRPPRKVP